MYKKVCKKKEKKKAEFHDRNVKQFAAICFKAKTFGGSFI